MTNKLTFGQSMIAGLIAAALSAVFNSILFFIFHSIGWITDDIFVQPGQPMTVVPVIIASIIPTLLAAMFFFVLEKYTKNGFGIFRMATVVLMLLSLAMPFTAIENATTNYSLALVLMHLVVGIAVIYFISRSKKSNP